MVSCCCLSPDSVGTDETIEVLVAAAVAVHQAQQVLDVARADVDHCAVDGLQVLLQRAELPPAHGLALAFVGVEALDGDEFGAGSGAGFAAG